MPVRHVLVVDDSKSARLMLRKMLQGFGLTVDTVESAEEALNYLRSQRPDAIFMDHTMPGMDGLTAVRRIHADPETTAIPVAMYTSKDEPAYRSEAYAAGAMDVLIKPAVPDVLGAMIERMNALVDVPPPVETPKTASEAAAVSESVTVAWVEKLALEKAEMVFYEAIESQVLPLINDVIAKLRREIESGQEGVATRVCEARMAAWQPPLKAEAALPVAAVFQAQMQPLLENRLETFRRDGQTEIERRVREVAAEICQGQLHELSERLVRQLSLRFTETSHKVVATAREAAREAALQAIAETTVPSTGTEEENRTRIAGTGQSVMMVAEQAAQRVWVEAQSDLLRHIYWAAGGAAVTGIGAAALAYGLLR
jgi:CheY-like chemotaxis protein